MNSTSCFGVPSLREAPPARTMNPGSRKTELTRVDGEVEADDDVEWPDEIDDLGEYKM